MKYTDEQNTYHFLRALQSANEPDVPFTRPFDCPPYRWETFLREAKRSLPSLKESINALARSPMTATKRVESQYRP